MKKLSLLIALCAIVVSASVQLKIVNAGNVGIGTNNPAQKLHVLGNSVITGNVGIGTTNPAQKLHVVGNSVITGNVGIGTTNPTQKLHVVGKTALMDSVGIGITNPAQKLHVVGKTALMDNVGIGTTNPTQKLHVNGNAFISGKLGIDNINPVHKLDILYGTVRFSLWGGDSYGVIFNGENTWGAPQIISKGNQLLLGNEQYPVNAIYVNYLFYRQKTAISDERLKENIKPLGSVLDRLMEVEGKSFNFKQSEDSIGITDFEEISKEIKFGFIAQELEKIFPELVLPPNPTNSYYSVDYDGMIAVLAEAVKEQQEMIEKSQKSGEQQKIMNDEWRQEIETLRQEIESLREILALCCHVNHSESIEPDNMDRTQPVNLSDPTEFDAEEMQLFQNTPNPFYETTTIQCYLPETIYNVELCVYNMQGVQVKCIPITERGLVNLQIAAGQLSAGAYTYLLIGDGKSSDAKKMILTK